MAIKKIFFCLTLHFRIKDYGECFIECNEDDVKCNHFDNFLYLYFCTCWVADFFWGFPSKMCFKCYNIQ